MNVLLVTMEMNIGGAETHVLELARALKKKGYKVYVISAGGQLVKELESEEIEHIFAPLKDKKINHILSAYIIIKKAIKEKNIDVVHAHARIPGAICGFACKKMRTHFVTTVHGTYRVNYILKKLTNWGERTLAVSKDIEKYVIDEYKLESQNVFLTVNGIDTEKFIKEEISENIDIKLDESKTKIIHIGRIDKESSEVAKMLISVADELNEKLSGGAQLIIVGAGTAFDEIKEISKDNKNIILTGARTDINKLLNVSDIFVGVSRAALEAMACELPVILAGNSAYNQGYIGILDSKTLDAAIDTNFTCRGFPKVSKERLVEDIIRLAKEKDKEIGKNNRKIVETNYSVDKMANDAIKVYKF